MSPRNRKMTTWSFRITPEAKAETIRCAEIADESDSEYIRKAVEMRNSQHKQNKYSDEKTKQIMRQIPN